VVTIPDPHAPRGFFSKELCGGTHVHRIGDVGILKVVSEQSVAAGVRRIEAVTGIGALEHYQAQARILSQLAGQLNVGEDAILSTVEKLSQTAKSLEKELELQKTQGRFEPDGRSGRASATRQRRKTNCRRSGKRGSRRLAATGRQPTAKARLRSHRSGDAGRWQSVIDCGVTKDLTPKVHAGKLIQILAKQVGGSGGGRPDLARLAERTQLA